MSPLGRRRLIRLVLLLIVAGIIATAGQRLLGLHLDARLVVGMLALGAVAGLLFGRR